MSDGSPDCCRRLADVAFEMQIKRKKYTAPRDDVEAAFDREHRIKTLVTPEDRKVFAQIKTLSSESASRFIEHLLEFASEHVASLFAERQDRTSRQRGSADTRTRVQKTLDATRNQNLKEGLFIELTIAEILAFVGMISEIHSFETRITSEESRRHLTSFIKFLVIGSPYAQQCTGTLWQCLQSILGQDIDTRRWVQKETDIIEAISNLRICGEGHNRSHLMVSMLHQETITVLHPDSGLGWIVRVSGVSMVEQLHALLAAIVIPDIVTTTTNKATAGGPLEPTENNATTEEGDNILRQMSEPTMDKIPNVQQLSVFRGDDLSEACLPPRDGEEQHDDDERFWSPAFELLQPTAIESVGGKMSTATMHRLHSKSPPSDILRLTVSSLSSPSSACVAADNVAEPPVLRRRILVLGRKVIKFEKRTIGIVGMPGFERELNIPVVDGIPVMRALRSVRASVELERRLGTEEITTVMRELGEMSKPLRQKCLQLATRRYAETQKIVDAKIAPATTTPQGAREMQGVVAGSDTSSATGGSRVIVDGADENDATIMETTVVQEAD